MPHEHGDSRPSSAEEAFARLVELQEAGAAPDVEQWLARFPEFEPELRALLAFRAEAAAWRAEGTGPPGTAEGTMYRSRTRRRPSPEVGVDPLALRPGARFGDFVLLRRIAEGGMGQVWEALQRPLQRIVALKFIRPDRDDASGVALFAREARAASRINDPRIITVHATGETDGVHWIAQEYVPGECTLGDFLEEVRGAGEYPSGYFDSVARFFADVAEAMHIAHEADVVHRDLKPGNILIAPGDRPKIADFGLARLIDEASLSGTRAVVGTPHYMSPEQVAGSSHDIDRRSDVFSLGAVLYQVLTLRKPFEGKTTPELFARITLVDPPDPRAVEHKVPRDLSVIAMKALEKRREDRYGTMAALAADLRRYLADEPIHARAPTPTQRMSKWVRRHPAAAAALALAVLTGILAIAFVVQGGQVRDEKMRSHIERAWLYIDNGDLDSAAQQVRSFNDLAPEDPEGHLVLAAGLARYGHMGEARSELEQARGKGYGPRVEAEESAESLYLRALYRIAEGSRAGLPEAATLIERAMALDPERIEAWQPLYQVYRVIGDRPRAAAALNAYKQGLRYGGDRFKLAEALEAELRGELDAAVAKLDELASGSPDRVVELRVQRHRGRLELALYQQQADLGHLDRAQEALAEALEAFPEDTGSSACMALVHLERAQVQGEDVERRRQLTLAEDVAADVLAVAPGNVMALEVRARAALRRVMDDFDRDNAFIAPEHLAAARERQAQLAEADPGNELARGMESDLYFFLGMGARKRGERGLAVELLEESRRAYEQQLAARVALGAELYNHQQDFDGAVEVLAEALEIWDEELARHGPGRWDRMWLFRLLTYLVGAADRAGGIELASRSRERMLTELTDGARADPADVFTFVEFIATPAHPQLQDCAAALRLLEEHGIEARYGGRGGAAQGMLDAIHAACPE